MADTCREFEISAERGGSILMFQTILAVSLIRKAVVADRYNPITYVNKINLEFYKGLYKKLFINILRELAN